MIKEFGSLAELMEAFAEPQAAIDYFTAIRWKDGQFCPYCGNTKLYKIKNSNRWKCADRDCFNSFSILVGTIFENTKLPLKIWFGAMWLITNHKKGIASTTLARDLDITQKAAWFVLHRLRYAAKTNSFNGPLKGDVEVDETFVGGKAANRHKNKRGDGSGGLGSGKSAVIGAVSRKGAVVARVIETTDTKTMDGFVHGTVSPHADLVVTDEHSGYRHLGRTYPHEVIRKSTGTYGDGDVHTNTIEGVWSLLKRQIVGIHHYVSPKHLDQYVGEMSWRYNRRGMTAGGRVNDMCANVGGRLTYKQLTA